MFGKFLGWFLVIAGVAGLGGHFGTGGLTIGAAWRNVSANSLVGFESLIDRYFTPPEDDPSASVWFDVVLPVLELPLWLVVAIICFVFSAIFFISAQVGERREIAGESG